MIFNFFPNAFVMKFLAKCEGDLSKPQNILAKLNHNPTTHAHQIFIENFQIKEGYVLHCNQTLFFKGPI
jgi:hypothetical protein